MANNSTESSTNTPPANMNGFQRNTSMDYLLDPRYAIMQVQQEEMAEYQQFKQMTGQDITIEQYRMLKYSSNGDSNNYTGESDEKPKSLGSRSTTSSNSSQRTVANPSSCSRCYGLGTCRTCEGRGYYFNPYDLSKRVLCPNCKNHDGRCTSCNGTGKKF